MSRELTALAQTITEAGEASNQEMTGHWDLSRTITTCQYVRLGRESWVTSVPLNRTVLDRATDVLRTTSWRVS